MYCVYVLYGNYELFCTSSTLVSFAFLCTGNFDNLQARNALVGTLEAQVIRTQNRDIGYHIPLKDLSQKGELNEGDVVGFFEDDYEKTVIERLSKENYHRAKLAGVITRSFYVEGLCPESQKGILLSNHSLIHLLIRSITHSLTHSITQSLKRSFIYSFTNLLTRSLV